MSEVRMEPPPGETRTPGLVVERVLGRVRGPEAGPTLVVLGGLHGNEPAGILAATRVAAQIAPRANDLRGEFVALSGNRRALQAGRRFLVRDLNRAWTRRRVEALRAEAGPVEAGEDQEQAELIAELDRVFAEARGPIFVLDLHTTSGSGLPFSTAADTLRNRGFALSIPAPLVLGLEERVEGTLMDWVDGLGHTVSVFESGQNEDAAAVGRAEGAIWIALGYAGLLDESRVPEAQEWRDELRRERGEVPRALEVRHRHPVREGDGFSMLPGFLNFQRVESGQVLASDAEGDVRAPERGRVLMPLYQKQGNDGFFLVREFSFFWLTFSAFLRQLRVDRVVHWLPGIHRTESGERLLVNKRVARWYALELLHLLGYRRQRESGRHLLVERRPED